MLIFTSFYFPFFNVYLPFKTNFSLGFCSFYIVADCCCFWSLWLHVNLTSVQKDFYEWIVNPFFIVFVVYCVTCNIDLYLALVWTIGNGDNCWFQCFCQCHYIIIFRFIFFSSFFIECLCVLMPLFKVMFRELMFYYYINNICFRNENKKLDNKVER